MITTEYVRNLNRNYERVLLEDGVDTRRYQYMILNRGGIKYLLPGNCRNIEGRSYLYYEISSSQNVRQLFSGKSIGREWIKNFFWSIQRLRQELNRFLLDERNIVWNPEHIYQELEKGNFLYMYLPYRGQENDWEQGFDKMLEFWVERVDYEDEALVEYVYYAYEQYVSVGQSYLEKQIFEDFRKMEENKLTVRDLNGQSQDKQKRQENPDVQEERRPQEKQRSQEKQRLQETQRFREKQRLQEKQRQQEWLRPEETLFDEDEEEGTEAKTDAEEKKGFRFFKESRRRRNEQKNLYREEMRNAVNGYAVCEETSYDEHGKEEQKEEEFGRTIYVEESVQQSRRLHGLYTEKGDLVIHFDKYPFVLGKRREDADFVLSDYASSRIHARFVKENEDIYLEDLNSTNGTFKNGLRMQPYEKRQLESGDELRFGKSIYIYK